MLAERKGGSVKSKVDRVRAGSTSVFKHLSASSTKCQLLRLEADALPSSYRFLTILRYSS